jgi:hypothetical protein
MPNYQNAQIYKLWSPSQNLVYYGSTTQPLTQRLSKHLYNYKNKKNIASELVLECFDYKIELVEYYPCDNRQQLCKKEGEYIKSAQRGAHPLTECVNKHIAGRTMKEYYADNIENYKEYNKKNKERIKQYYKEYNKRSKQPNELNS